MRPVLALAAIALLTGCSASFPARPLENVADGVAQSDKLLAETLQTDEPGCSAAVARDGEIAWAAARGQAVVATSSPITVDTKFDIASVSKQFTGWLVAEEVAAGSMSLDDSLSTYIDELPAWADRVTIDQLVHHTSGIPDYIGLLREDGIGLEEPVTHDDAIRRIAELAEVPAPGRFEYSNSNYILLAEVLERHDADELPAMLASRVFGPRGLDMVLEPNRAADDSALSYSDGKLVRSEWTQLGDGSIYSTPSTLALWGSSYAEVGDVVDIMISDPVETGAPDKSRYGAGIVVGADGALTHTGGWAGFVTVFGVSADRSTVIALSCNSTDAPIDEIAAALLTIWQP